MNRTSHKAVSCSLFSFSAARVVSLSISLAALGLGSAKAVLLFRDNFEYAVDRSGTGPCPNFSANGWAGVKSNNCTGGGAGYLYTTTTIPGFSGTFPGSGSARVLGMEAKPFTQQTQTDFYLQFGRESGPIGQIPANYWFQFWIYLNDFGTEASRLTQGKFLYLNRANAYPATIDNGGFVLWHGIDSDSKPDQYLSPCPSIGCNRGFLTDNWAGPFTSQCGDCSNRLGQNLSTLEPVVSNQWTLVKIHVDVSGTDPRAAPGQAVEEVWIRRQNEGSWTKITEWIGGVTPGCGPLPGGCGGDRTPVNMTPAYTDGFRMLRMPTTVGATTSSPGDWFDYWIYMDDFVLADSETDLPTYGVTPTAPPQPPRGLRTQ